jgi:apolipoprotein N-acyltransferase
MNGASARAAPLGQYLLAHRRTLAIAIALGALSVLGFSPFNIFVLPIVALAALLLLWERADGARAAMLLGFSFGLGFFLCGVSWVYVSLHQFGAMPAPLAAIATLAFCAFLALFPAAVGYAWAKVRSSSGVELALFFPALWTLAEWTRGWIFTGFPWLALGYSQIPISPLAGLAPIAGIYGVTLGVAVTAGLLAHVWQTYRAGRIIARFALTAIAVLWVTGGALKAVVWTEPVGEPITVSLLQGNVPQDLKFQEDRIHKTLEDYRALALSSSSKLIVFPETALPLFLEYVPQAYLDTLAAHARRNGGDMLIGVPERRPDGRYYNSVISVGSAPPQRYHKFHLVPFGEFIPLRPILGGIVGALAIPLQDFSRGPSHPRPLELAGQRVAVNVCYEDAFGEEIIRQLPHATLLVNVSNVAWFGRSIAPDQHLQISQARALETGRFMLRATNTGATAVIDPRGKVVKIAPPFARTVLSERIHGYQGATPYVRWGNSVAIAICVIMLGAGWFMRRNKTA